MFLSKVARIAFKMLILLDPAFPGNRTRYPGVASPMILMLCLCISKKVIYFYGKYCSHSICISSQIIYVFITCLAMCVYAEIYQRKTCVIIFVVYVLRFRNVTLFPVREHSERRCTPRIRDALWDSGSVRSSALEVFRD